MKRLIKKLMAGIWCFFTFRRDILARITNLDRRLAVLELSEGTKSCSKLTISTGRQDFPGGRNG